MVQRNKLLMLLSVFIFLLSVVNGFLSESSNCLSSKHFVLVHGSGHGAWSWFKLVALLKSSGHNVTAIDLAASGIDLQPVKSLRSVSEYHQPLINLMASLPSHEKVILVGHSLGGLAISQAMEKFPDKISVAVFVTALMPGPSLNISFLNNEVFHINQISTVGSLLDSHYAYDDGPNSPPTALIFGPLFLSSIMYHLSPNEDRALATALVRPLRLYSNEDMAKEIVLTSESYGLVDRVFVISEKDELSKNDFQEWMIEKNPPNEVIEILGCDHMIMMSKPTDLWALLLSVAAKYS